MNKAYDVEETRGLRRQARARAAAHAPRQRRDPRRVRDDRRRQRPHRAGRVESLGIGPGAWTAISLLRYPLVLALVAFAVAALFRFGPNVAVSFRWTLVGGIVFAVGWLAATALFGIYVANFGSYANTYGALGGVIVLMLWFYLTALLLLVAAEVTPCSRRSTSPRWSMRGEPRRARPASAKAGARSKGRRDREDRSPAPAPRPTAGARGDRAQPEAGREPLRRGARPGRLPKRLRGAAAGADVLARG